MPTTYTHYRVGDRCKDRLPAELKRIVEEHRSLYNFGVHGPDIFFYYNPLMPNAVTKFGSKMHKQPAREFFKKVRETFEKELGGVWKPAGEEILKDRREQMLSYVLGFLSHFAEDSCCHGYVERKREALGITHNRLEAVYDAYMMQKDGYRAVKVNRGNTLSPSVEVADVIASFFDFDTPTVLKTLKGQVFMMGLFHSPTGIKKTVLRAIVRIFKIPGEFDDLFIDEEIPDSLKEANARMDALSDQAVDLYEELAPILVKYIDGEIEELPEYFDKTFDKPDNYLEIPV